MRQLAGHTNAELVWVKSNSLKLCTPIPISPRRYQPPVSMTATGWIGWGALIGGKSAGVGQGKGAPGAAALAEGKAAASAAPANKATLRLRMTPSSRTRWTERTARHRNDGGTVAAN